MPLEQNHIDLLIANNLSGEATPEEKDQLTNLINQSSANQRLFNEYKIICENLHSYFPATEISADRKKIKDQIIGQLSIPAKRVGINFWFIGLAAILAMPLMLAIGWYVGSREISSETRLCEVTAPKGQISRCVLSDGTQVWLNAGSTLKYDPALRGKVRQVSLDGEAFFEVSKNTNKPFIVTTERVHVKVLGTIFNLKAYSGEKKVEATLEEGRIEFTIDGNASKPIELKPGEQVVFDKIENKTTLGKVETYLHTAWKDGKYVFKNADLATIIIELEKLYDVRIHLGNDSLRKLHFRGMFEYDQNIFSALETLERTTHIKYRMTGRDIWLQ